MSLLAPSFFEPQPYVLFLVITLLAAWLAGREGGTAAAIVGVVAGIVVLRAARGNWTVQPAAGLWLAINLLAAILVGSLRSALLQMRQALAGEIPTSDAPTPNRPVRTQWFEVTLSSIGDAVIATDEAGAVVFVNDQAALLTGWSQAEAQGRPLQDIFQIRNASTGAEVENPVARVLRENRIVGLANHTVLIRRDGIGLPIADSGAPIYSPDGSLIGVVLVFRDVTQQREAERLMAASARHLSRVLDTLPTLVGVLTPDGVIVEANRAALEIASLNPADVLDKPFADAYWWSYSGEVQAQLRDAIAQAAQGHTTRRDMQIRVADDTLITVDFSLVPMRDDEGRVTHLIPSALDISQRKHVEDALRLSEERLRTAIKSSRMTVFSQDQDLRYTWIDNSLRGLTTADVLGKLDEDIITDPNDATRIKAFKREVLESGVGAQREIMAYWQGREIYLDMTVEPLHAADGTVCGIICAALDVTERRRAALERERLLAEIAQERDRLRTLIDSITDEIWFCDAAGNIELVNAAVRKAFGLDADPGADLGQLATFVAPLEIHTADGLPRRTEDAPLLRALRGETIRSEVESVRIGNDTRAYRRASAAPLTNSSGDIVGAVAVVHDITEQVKAEEAIQSLNAELEQRVRERTAQLSAVNHELEAFSYSVSHDLRTPLRAIDGFSHALLEDYGDILDQDAHYYLERIRIASQRLGQLIDDLLKLSRLTRSDIQRTPTNLSEIARSALDELHEAHPEREVQMVIQPDVVVEADAHLLRVAMDNLLNNAWKFTARIPNARIEFGTLDYEDERVYYVRDNGAGFDMTYADKLFGAFQRLHSATEFEGTGIGLATVQRIIHRHRGRIWSQGVVNEGATFYFTLPTHRGNDHGRGASENDPVGGG
ncbi:PAS domain-containing sensor histidine kinase [Aggregatilinea lenta]|uniref:PAS domain-containing sensor histidine kinase n=1 Tax=Aggregatilinea lenta TaxID=913108 RepID=UPI0013C322E6|nr:PAS domain-containing protein [Aggregatilinea lenta]